jgi:ribosome assembly protein YihI (activator of Der GTPase)
MGIIATRTNGGHAASERDDGYTQEILKRLAAIEKALGITTEDDGGTDAENGGTE